MNLSRRKTLAFKCLGASIFFVNTASAAVMNSGFLYFDLASLTSSGDITPYTYSSTMPHVNLPMNYGAETYTGPISMVSSYAQSGSDWYGYYYGMGFDVGAAESNSYMGSAHGRSYSNPNSLTPNAVVSAEASDSDFAEAWMFYIYGFTANSSGQVDFSANFSRSLELATDGSAPARAWAFAGMSILSAFPGISPESIQQNNPLWIYSSPEEEYFVNGNDIVSPNALSLQDLSFPYGSLGWGMLPYAVNDPLDPCYSGGCSVQESWDGSVSATANVSAGETYYMLLAGYVGAGRDPFTSSRTAASVAVPEPETLLLMLAGLVVLGGFSRKGLSERFAI